MEYSNGVEPTQDKIEGLLNEGDEGPIYMVNLLKYKTKAEYADGRQTSLTGREAYALYGAGVVRTLADVGGSLVFAGEVCGLLVGDVEDLWDDVAIAMYPNKAAMVKMFSSPKYQEIHVHRDAGLSGQLNIETRVRGSLAESAGDS
jgi:uncharacterized protein (DUF1330 family)